VNWRKKSSEVNLMPVYPASLKGHPSGGLFAYCGMCFVNFPRRRTGVLRHGCRPRGERPLRLETIVPAKAVKNAPGQPMKKL